MTIVPFPRNTEALIAEFRARLGAALEKEPGLRAVILEEEARSIRVVDLEGAEHRVQIGAAERDYAAKDVASERDDFLERVVRLTVARPTESEEFGPRDFRPLIRTSDLSWSSALHSRAQEPRPGAKLEPSRHVARPLSDGLVLMLAIDSEDAIQILYEGSPVLDRWSREEMEGIGLANLRELTPDPPEHVDGGIYRSGYDDNYDTSRALLTDWACGIPAEGRHPVALPSRDILLIGSEGSAAAMMETTRSFFNEAARPLSHRLYAPENGGLVPWEVSDRHPLRHEVQGARVNDLLFAYGNQKKAHLASGCRVGRPQAAGPS